MKRKPIQDLCKSIHDRLQNRAKADGVSYTAVFTYYVIERFLYRLSCSAYRDNFILKGANLFRVWGLDPFRTTADTDLLGRNISNSIEEIKRTICEIVSTTVPEDGLIFLGDQIQCSSIMPRATYPGINVVVPVLFAKKHAPSFLHIDIGFGDPTYPMPQKDSLEPMLEEDAKPVILCYCKENVIAEKIEAIIYHDKINSRLKDFADIFFLSENYSFNGNQLMEAIRRTFKSRNTKIDPNLSILHEEDFLKTKSIEWIKYRADKLRSDKFPNNFTKVVARIIKFIQPIFAAINSDAPFNKKWIKGKGWDSYIKQADQKPR